MRGGSSLIRYKAFSLYTVFCIHTKLFHIIQSSFTLYKASFSTGVTDILHKNDDDDDGNAVACGQNEWGECDIPPLPAGVTYVHRGAQIVLASFFCESYASFCLLSGAEVFRCWVNASDTLVEIRKVFKCKTMADYGKYCVVLPNGELLSVACAQAPSTIIEPLLIRKRVRRI